MRLSDLLLAFATTPLPVPFSRLVPAKVATPLHVVVPTPLPVTLPTPLPVHTVGGPPDWLIWWGFLLSCATLLVAAATLVGVGYQIHFAKEQIRLANDQIGLAQEELKAVQADLDNQREQMQEFRRRPDLHVGFTNMVPTFAMVGSQRKNLNFMVMNQGSRATTECHVRLFFPETADTGTASWIVDEKEYRALEVTIATPLYPGNTATFQVDNVRCHESFEFLWEVNDDFGHYPAKGRGKLDIQVIQPTA